MNLLALSRGLLTATLLTSLVACGGASGPGPSAQAFAMNPVAEAAKTGDVPTPSLRCAP